MHLFKFMQQNNFEQLIKYFCALFGIMKPAVFLPMMAGGGVLCTMGWGGSVSGPGAFRPKQFFLKMALAPSEPRGAGATDYPPKTQPPWGGGANALKVQNSFEIAE